MVFCKKMCDKIFFMPFLVSALAKNGCCERERGRRRRRRDENKRKRAQATYVHKRSKKLVTHNRPVATGMGIPEVALPQLHAPRDRIGDTDS